MTLADHIAKAARGTRFPGQRIIDLVQLLRLRGTAAQNTAEWALLRLVEMDKG